MSENQQKEASVRAALALMKLIYLSLRENKMLEAEKSLGIAFLKESDNQKKVRHLRCILAKEEVFCTENQDADKALDFLISYPNLKDDRDFQARVAENLGVFPHLKNLQEYLQKHNNTVKQASTRVFSPFYN